MKLLDHFKTFMTSTVNLNETRIKQLADSINAVESVIRALDWGPAIKSFESQGSWPHGTIIKPLPNVEFDADLVVFVEHKEGWEPKDYINKLASALEGNKIYEGKLQRWSHCVTIHYAGERRIDVAPCVVGRRFIDEYEVCNRDANEFEPSNPTGYTKWVVEKNAVAGGNDLKKVTRLLKYMRDIKGNFTCPSFLLTTLLGNRINSWDKDSSELSDLPTTLKTLVDRLDDWLQQNVAVPDVRNPVLRSEVQSNAWNETQYKNFRDKIHLYRGWIDEAYDEQERDESIRKWRKVFGDNFASGESAKKSVRACEAADVASSGEIVAIPSTGAIVVPSGYRDLVDMVKALGSQAVPPALTQLPHIKRPPWRKESVSYTVKVNAELVSGSNSTQPRQIHSLQPQSPGYSIRFTAVNHVGAPFPTGYKVMWRVTNTDRTAFAAGQLRGGFYPSDTGTSRIESLSYRGVHFVEAFLLRKHDDSLVGASDPFYVVIE